MVFRRPLIGSLLALVVASAGHAVPLRVGAYVQDVSPTVFPVIINGGMAERLADKVVDPVNARAFVIEGDKPVGGGREKIAIVVVDSCMLPRELLDVAKEKAKALTGIATDRMLISATHTHSAPSSMGCLGSDEDVNYTKALPDQLARAIAEADKRLAPAQIGWVVVQDPDHTAIRRWIFRPDRMRNDPFGELIVRATMHPGHLSPDAISEAGPEDPGLTIVSFKHADGRPLALLANYSMHYFSSPAVSADYFGKFAAKVSEIVAPGEKDFVAAMSQGTSGDVWLADYAKPAPAEKRNIEVYSRELAENVSAATKGINYTSEAPVAMAEATLKLKRRVPDEKRLAWAREKVAALQKATGEGKPLKPRQQPDIYAREAVLLHETPERELKLQAIRIADLALTGIPNEVYALTGLKLKAMSPLPTTANVSLANGSEGYIPPPEQHPLGGYTTWPARTAALEPQAEPRIVEAVVTLLAKVAGKPRRNVVEGHGAYAKAVLAAKPMAYFRMADMAGPRAADASGNGNDGRYEDGVVFWLPGPESAGNAITGAAERINRAAHFAGGRLRARGPGDTYTVEMWVWNGMPAEARDAAGILFFAGRGDDEAAHPTGDCVWIGGKGEHAGKLMAGQEYSFTAAGNWRSPVKVIGKTRVPDRTWAHVAIVRGKQGIRLYLNGQLEAEGQPGKNVPGPTDEITLGGAGTKAGNTLEGRLDEVAIYARELSGEEIAAHFKAAAVMAQAPVTPPQGTAPLPQPVATASASPAAYKRSAEPLSPPESLKKIHVGPEYAIELVAHEPLVVDPVAIDWGYDGKLWVVEFADYPYGMDGKGSAGGRIKFLTDTDGDGKYDKATLFMDGVKMPTGVMAWRKGVIVAAAPEIFYAEDTDGDGKADRREVLYKGFKEGNPQLRVNALRWGLDSWVYVSNGLSGGTVESIRGAAKGKPVAPVDIKNKDLRVRPDTGEMELVSGPSQWGRARDAFGRWFGTHNAQPLFHLTLEDRYLRRNPDVTYPDVRRQLLPMPMPPLFPKSAFAKRYIGLDHHGHFTSGSGISVETTRLTAGGTEPVIRAYVCDPVHNLVQAQELSEAGASFAAARVAGAGTADFVAGEDPWFRPVMTRPGPDGALWVVDMYRYMIEHPDWLNEQGKRELAPFYRDGDDRGRIYRVYRKGLVLKPMPTIRLTDSRDALVEQLTSGSALVRDLAHRAIVWQVADGGGIDASLREKLEHLIEKSESSAAQAQAIGLLDGAGGVTPAFANRLLGLRHPGLLALAVRVAERFEWKAVGPRLSEIAATTSDPGVRAQVACTLGQFENAEAGAVLAGLAAVDGDDAILAAAIASAAKPHEKVLVDRVLATPALAGKPLADYLLTMAVRRKDTATVGRFADKLLADANPPAAQMDALAKLAEVLGGRGMSLADLDKPVGAGRIERLRAIVKSATRRAADERAAPADRRAATELLGRLPERRAADLATAAALLVPRTPAEVQLAAVRAVARTQDPAAPQALLAAWPSLSPAVRVAIADALMAREPWAAELAKSPAARELDFARKQRLLNHKSAVVKDAAKATLAATGPGAAGDRQKVIDEYAEAMRLAPDLKHGQQVYAEQCATCHQVGSLADAAGKVLGNDIGPNLLTVRDWTKESLLAGILDPDRTVAPQFIAYNATTAGGDQHTGLIVAESAGGISIRTVDGRVQEIPRGSLKSLVSTGRSLMPQGFESALSPQDVADLMGFITDPARR